MKAICFGSLNIDFIYDVPHFIAEGETMSSLSLQTLAGGKGLNQAIALARAGVHTLMGGAIGQDGGFLVDLLKQSGVDCESVSVHNDVRTGHAIIQRDPRGENCIILYGGANQAISFSQVREILTRADPGDLLLLQNEINANAEILAEAKRRGLRIVLNPSPLNQRLLSLPLEQVDYFILNEVEAGQLLGIESEPAAGEKMICAIREKYPASAVILTLGADGALYADAIAGLVRQEAYRRETVDTTGAGDTFTGYFFAGICEALSPLESMRRAAMASAIAVTRPGAAPSIPWREEVDLALKTFHLDR